MNNLKSVLIETLKHFPKFDTNERHNGIPNDRKVTKMRIPIVKSFIKSHKYDIFTKKLLTNLDVDCSYGLGRHWASIPWISIFNPYQYVKHPSAMRGIYLVYLFSNDLRRIYLSLNMGTTRFSKAYQRKNHLKMPTINKEILSEIKNYSFNLKLELLHLYKKYNRNKYYLIKSMSSPILLKDNTKRKDNSKRGNEYENGNIISIHYTLNKLNSMTNAQILSDLQKMSLIYSDLMYKIMPRNSFIKNDVEYSHNKVNKGLALSGMPKVFKGILVDHPEKIKDKNNKKLNKSRNKVTTTNHIQQDKKLSKLGDNGEKYVVNYELKKLRRSNPSLASKKNVHQVSATATRKGNNSLGYDVISRNTDGSKLFIEVKTTSVNDQYYPFEISNNEIDFAKAFINNNNNYQPKNYRLYRLYNARYGKQIKIRIFSPESIVKASKDTKYNQIISYKFFI